MMREVNGCNNHQNINNNLLDLTLLDGLICPQGAAVILEDLLHQGIGCIGNLFNLLIVSATDYQLFNLVVECLI